jgi:hypothetical protein
MSQTFSTTLHLSSSSVPATAAPVSLCIWTNNTGGQGRRIMVLSAGASEATGVLGVLTDTTGSSNKVNAYRVSSAGSGNQALTSCGDYLGIVAALGRRICQHEFVCGLS